jgi:hypothetical protein
VQRLVHPLKLACCCIGIQPPSPEKRVADKFTRVTLCPENFAAVFGGIYRHFLRQLHPGIPCFSHLPGLGWSLNCPLPFDRLSSSRWFNFSSPSLFFPSFSTLYARVDPASFHLMEKVRFGPQRLLLWATVKRVAGQRAWSTLCCFDSPNILQQSCTIWRENYFVCWAHCKQ